MSDERTGGTRHIVAVIGAGRCEREVYEAARAIGRILAGGGAVVATGGLGGVMEAASRGAKEAGGLNVGLLPGEDARAANPFVDLALPTGIGEARNVLLVRAARSIVAVAGGYGTLSEIAIALKLGKPIFGWRTWSVDPALRLCEEPEEAARLALEAAGLGKREGS